MIDLIDGVDDPDLSENFLIRRSTGKFAAGGFVVTRTDEIKAYGVVTIANSKDLAQMPESDQITEAMIFRTTLEMFVTNAANSQLSDVLVWRGTQYRILNVWPYVQRGYWRAIATRLLGD